MTSTFEYTDKFYAWDSSVVDVVFYNKDSSEMVVVLHSGAKAGYLNVTPEVFAAFELQNTTSGSVGRFWNQWIKPYFTGFDTSHIRDFGRAATSDSVQDVVEPKADSYVLFFTVDDETVMEQALFASDEAQALSKFEDVSALAGFGDTTVLSVLHIL